MASSPSSPPDSLYPFSGIGSQEEQLEAPRVARHVIAVAGGRGGVGKSIVAVNLGVYLAQLGRTVVVVDANPAGADLHTLLGEPMPTGRAGDEATEDEELSPIKTQVPGMLLLPQAYSQNSTVPLRPGRKPRWAFHVRQLDVDYVIFDLGAGTAPATLDLFLSADVGLTVTAPEPPSVEATYRFVRALFQRKLRRALLKDRFKVRMVERAQEPLPPLPSPIELVRAIARYDRGTAELAAAELAKLRPRLIVNSARLRTDNDLGPAMGDMGRRYLGVEFDYVGHIEQEDSVWLSVVRRRPLLIDSPTSKAARNIERIARRILALVTTREQAKVATPVPLVRSEPDLYESLWTHRGATDEELRRAYKRQREIYLPDSLPLTSLLTEEELARERARVDEAYDTLLDPIRRRAYDKATSPEPDSSAEAPRPEVDAALAAERAMLRAELAREIHPETEFTGELLRKVRQSLGIELEEIAGKTKISLAHLSAIEEEDFKALPATVYARGFVHEIAKLLKVDPTQVSRTYLKRLRAARGAGE